MTGVLTLKKVRERARERERRHITCAQTRCPESTLLTCPRTSTKGVEIFVTERTSSRYLRDLVMSTKVQSL